MATDFRKVIASLAGEGVDYVIIGGLALVAHGSSRVTVDLDLCYSRTPENIARLARALRPLSPRLRDFPPELPFFWDDQTLRTGLNFTLTSDAGDVDLLGEVAGVGSYAEALARSVSVSLYGFPVAILSLDALESAKRAAGRAKDLLDLGEIAVIRRRLGGLGPLNNKRPVSCSHVVASAGRGCHCVLYQKYEDRDFSPRRRVRECRAPREVAENFAQRALREGRRRVRLAPRSR